MWKYILVGGLVLSVLKLTGAISFSWLIVILVSIIWMPVLYFVAIISIFAFTFLFIIMGGSIKTIYDGKY